ncbi:GAF domain-containing protein [Chitinophaga rhizophila]|uniref:GAF domain-containing protein n=1 Tax=Chitinophaga rhizophila TaxID=2866212 RepID=A0ABS7G591_9BACT|nr:GAF domain-containing protein [Chitinophaga rhizophila]MBW8682823.1 GAF domain-containing protein [Chitinophaga rhizophila]
MNLHSFPDSPFKIQLSFYQIAAQLEQQAAGAAGETADRAKALLAEIALHPELIEGLTTPDQIAANEDLIHRLLADYFPASLTMNEIKAVNLPYVDLILNPTQRFQNIMKAAGPDFSFAIRDFDEHQFYVLSCCIILNEFYGTTLDFGKPFFYDIPTADGVIKHYRILYNADFLDILPTGNTPTLTQEDIDLLLNSYDDLALWKAKFPKESWILKGFAIMTLYDATVENAVSIFKEKLLGINTAGFEDKIQSIFRSIYRIPDIKVGFTLYNPEDDHFTADPFGLQQMHSFIVQGNKSDEARKLLCTYSYGCVVKEKRYFAVSDMEEYLKQDPQNRLGNFFYKKGIRSFILAPVVKNGHLLGVVEMVSIRAKELNSINANKLEVVMPFLTDTVERLLAEMQNELQAVIQSKYTSIHESVYWKFRKEAERLIAHHHAGKEYTPHEIVFRDVYPLYGQIDIKGSSEVRNNSVQEDLSLQVKTLSQLLSQLGSFEAIQEQLRQYLFELSFPLKASTEQQITAYLVSEIHPLLQPHAAHPDVAAYFANNDRVYGSFHLQRRKYESTIAAINDKLTGIIDKAQVTAQQTFPHYFERFKTDGVEHNLYIGHSIAPKQPFDLQKLHTLRLWQLQTLCKMEMAHHQLKPQLPFALEVTSLILVYHSTISIRFRMDEKRFDVDGSYNARFEIVKKRIDKACIKDTNERITQSGKITIVYSNNAEEAEYLAYIGQLQLQSLLEGDIEQFEVEDLQGVSGLRAIRIKIVHDAGIPSC